MLEILEKLLVIQDRDRRIAQLKSESTRIPAEITAKGEAEKADLQKRAALIKQESEQLTGDRKQLVASVDPDLLSRYERLLRSKGDVAIVQIKHGTCGGCHLNIPPQVIHDAKK